MDRDWRIPDYKIPNKNKLINEYNKHDKSGNPKWTFQDIAWPIIWTWLMPHTTEKRYSLDSYTYNHSIFDNALELPFISLACNFRGHFMVAYLIICLWPILKKVPGYQQLSGFSVIPNKGTQKGDMQIEGKAMYLWVDLVFVVLWDAINGLLPGAKVGKSKA